ncbi:MAG TPA: hypothetical protein VJ770_30140 [Stellaceae bacterium]|nr:hypothetical protein [Stellaceae bacterium]
MTTRQKWTRSVIVAAAGVFAGLAWAHSGMAQARTPDGPIVCRDFARNGYGDWMVMRPTTISPDGMTMRLAPGQTFAPSQMVGGVEVSAALDRNCGNM